MDVKELADKIVKCFWKRQYSPSLECVAEIESLLAEAITQAKSEECSWWSNAEPDAYRDKIKSEAYERAAQVAEEFVQTHMGHAGDFDAGAEVTARKIAAVIRRLKDGGDER